MKARVEVDASDYERAHGRAPRGVGLWGFFFYGAPGDRGAWWAFVAAGRPLRFADARKAAVEEARRRGASSVSVAP